MTDKGTADKLKGHAKEAAGDLTGDKELKAKGKFDQAVGKAKEFAADAKEKAEELLHEGKKED